MTNLGVNIDHIATVRNARGEDHPYPYKAALFVMKSGANSVTIHLREDRRHIKDKDLRIISSNKNVPINLFNKGNHTRDFTYVDDTVNSIMKVILSNKKRKKFEIYNVSNNKAVPLMRYVREIEINLKKKIKKRLLNLQPGDIHKTHGSNLKFKKQFKYTPKVNVSEGVKNFINWFKNHHKN